MFWKQPTLIAGIRNFPDGCEWVSMEEHFSYLQYVQLQLWRLPTHTHGSALGEQQSGFNLCPVKLLFRDNYAREPWYCYIFDTWIMSKLTGITSQDDTMYGVNFTFSFLHAHSGEQIQSLTQDFSCMCFLNNTYILLVGSIARIQLTVLLITFKCCPPFGAKMLGGNAYHLLMVQIIAALLSNLPAKSIGAELQQHVTLPGNYFALFQPKSPRPLHIIIVAQVSLFNKQAIAESLHDKTSPWTLIKFEVLVLPDSKSSMLISLRSTRKWSVLGGQSEDVAELDGMVGKVERVSHMGNPIHLLVEQQMSLPDPDDNASMNNIQIAIMHKSWDPRSINMLTSHLQPSKVTGAMVFSKEARAVGGMVPCTLSGQEHAQRRGLKILMSMLTSHEAQAMSGYVDHKYYISVYNHYFLDISFVQVAIGHDYYNFVVQVNPDFDYHHDVKLVKEHRVQWDPGGSQWRGSRGKDDRVQMGSGWASVASTWGQAESQEGGNVRALP